jgi:predicted carbohydrate-binding protein with CBM5 and CBM33 domain
LSDRRRLAVLLAACLAPLALLATAAPAGAHGATSVPVSRALECSPLGGAAAKSAACQAADAVSGAGAFGAWDQLRVNGVNGRDREVIPDGRLCSGGIAQFHGVDLARADWPATKVVAGATFTFRYRETIAHQGTFRLYLTRPGYQPTRPLRWADLDSAPFLTVTNPPIAGTSYVFTGRLPTGRTGRQLIYTIWQNTSTADTYYSCSDVLFATAGGAAGPGPHRAPATTPAGGVASPLATKPAARPNRTAVAEPLQPAADKHGTSQRTLLFGVAGLIAVALVAGALLALRRRRRPDGAEHRA